MFIWIYGIYIVLTPLFAHFREPDGTNLVHTVAQRVADLGAAFALIWFILKLVSISIFYFAGPDWPVKEDLPVSPHRYVSLILA